MEACLLQILKATVSPDKRRARDLPVALIALMQWQAGSQATIPTIPAIPAGLGLSCPIFLGLEHWGPPIITQFTASWLNADLPELQTFV